MFNENLEALTDQYACLQDVQLGGSLLANGRTKDDRGRRGGEIGIGIGVEEVKKTTKRPQRRHVLFRETVHKALEEINK